MERSNYDTDRFNVRSIKEYAHRERLAMPDGVCISLNGFIIKIVLPSRRQICYCFKRKIQNLRRKGCEVRGVLVKSRESLAHPVSLRTVPVANAAQEE